MATNFIDINTIAVVTLKGHPLAGWRYWRVFLVGTNRCLVPTPGCPTNDIVVETGAVDKPAPGALNYIGFYIGKYTQLKCWREYLQYIRKALGARQVPSSQYDMRGRWNINQKYNSQNICQKDSCN